MKTLFIPAKYKPEVKLTNELIEYLKKYKKIALFTSIQFVNKIEEITRQLYEHGIKDISSQPERASEKFQILGCDVYENNLKIDLNEIEAFLYIGDGEFHPQTLLFSQGQHTREVVSFNPITNKFIIFSKQKIERILKKERGSLCF